MLDTGAGRLGAAFFHHAVQELGLGSADAPVREAHGAGGRLEVAVATLPWIELDGTRIAEPAVYFSQQEDGEADPFSVGVLGMGVLDRFRVTFDYLENRLGLVPVAAAVSVGGTRLPPPNADAQPAPTPFDFLLRMVLERGKVPAPC